MSHAFAAGMKEYGNDMTNLVTDLHQWFELSGARQEDYHEVQHAPGIPKHRSVWSAGGYVRNAVCQH